MQSTFLFNIPVDAAAIAALLVFPLPQTDWTARCLADAFGVALGNRRDRTWWLADAAVTGAHDGAHTIQASYRGLLLGSKLVLG